MTSRTVDAQNRSDVDSEAVADAVGACSHVAELSGGSVGEVATYLPGKRVVGVRTTDDALEVHVVGHYGPTVMEITSQVRAAAARHSGGRRVDVTVEDLRLDEPDEPDEPDESDESDEPARSRTAVGGDVVAVVSSTTVPGPMGAAPSSSAPAGTDPTTGLARPTRVTMPPAEPGLV